MTDIKRLRELEAKATKGPWSVDGDSSRIESKSHDVCRVYDFLHIADECRANRDFIIELRNALPALLDELEAARKVVEVARGVQEFLTPRAGEVDLRRGGDAALWHGDLKKALSAHAAAGMGGGDGDVHRK